MEVPIAPHAFVRLYKDYADFVWRSLRRLGVTESQVDDAVQEVFIVVHRRLPSFEGRSHIRIWLYGIVRRVASDFRRKSARDPIELPDVLEADPSRGPFEVIAKQEGLTLLWSLLDEMSPERREVLVLKELEELSGPEIAEMLDLDVENVYGRIRQARVQFSEAVLRHQARIDTKQATYQLQQASLPTRHDRRRLVAALALLFPQLAPLATAEAVLVPTTSASPAAGWLSFKTLSFKTLAIGASSAGLLSGLLLAVSTPTATTSAKVEAAPSVQQHRSSTQVARDSPRIPSEALTRVPTEEGTGIRKKHAPATATRTVPKTISPSVQREELAAEVTGLDEEASAVSASRLAEEAALLQEVMTALGTGQNAIAQRLLDKHRETFPNAQLRQEERRLRQRLHCRTSGECESSP